VTGGKRVATDRQIAANRLNSKMSTGPKSAAGKRRASQNARIHGLAGQSPMDPQWVAMVEQQAREIVNSAGGRIDLDRARLIADAEQDLIRARSISNAMAANLYAIHRGASAINEPNDGGLARWDSDQSTQLASLRVLARRNKAIRSCFEK
jgi:hypothetical protein